MYTRQELEALIRCPKRVFDPPRKEFREVRGQRRNEMTLMSLDGSMEFSCFMRINVDFPENFSIGLAYHPKDDPGELTLLRFNGPHGEVQGREEPSVHANQYHIHTAKEENFVLGRKPEWSGEPTDQYASFDEALRYFLKVVGVTDALSYFTDQNKVQTDLFH